MFEPTDRSGIDADTTILVQFTTLNFVTITRQDFLISKYILITIFIILRVLVDTQFYISKYTDCQCVYTYST